MNIEDRHGSMTVAHKILPEYQTVYELPEGAVIRDADGWVWENIGGDWKHTPRGLTSFVNSPTIPVHVLYEPGAFERDCAALIDGMD